MRIAYVITRGDAVGGATVHVRDLAQAMQALGHEVMVFVGGTGPVTEQLIRAGVPFQPLEFLRRPVSPVRDLRALAELTADWLAGPVKVTLMPATFTGYPCTGISNPFTMLHLPGGAVPTSFMSIPLLGAVAGGVDGAGGVGGGGGAAPGCGGGAVGACGPGGGPVPGLVDPWL